MLQKKENIGIWIWIPDNYQFKQSIAFFTLKNNLLIKNELYKNTSNSNLINNAEYVLVSPLENLIKNATIVIYENYATQELVDMYITYIANKIPSIAIFSFIKNRYSKPFTGGYELLNELAITTNKDFKFNTKLSIMVSNNIGINKFYYDRAFANNIGITTITTPDIFFRSSNRIIEWSYPTYILTINQKKKLFKFNGEPSFASFLAPECKNVIAITGPPHSGKTVLARRIALYLQNCDIYKNEYPNNVSKSMIHISTSPTYPDKINLLKWIIDNDIGSPNMVWIELDISKSIVELFRYLRVQINKKNNYILSDYSNITSYYKKLEFLPECTIPNNINHMIFPIVLKNIPELYYIY